MRISSRFAAGLVLLLASSHSAAVAANGVTFKSPDDAIRQGISAFNGGYYELAVPALEAVAQTNPVIGRYYLARIYSDNEGAYTDHARAFELFRALATELQDVDPDDETLAPIAAKSLTAVSRYLRSGLTEAKLKPDVRGADRALQRAALTFNNEDAQFELAKVLLRGEGPDITLGGGDDDPSSKIVNGRHWLSRLSRAGHPGAQAFLADLLWRGKFVAKDQATALNLIDVAVTNAPPNERVWIEDIYQNIFCNAGQGVRQQATGRVADWRDRYGRRSERAVDKDGLSDLAAEPVRTCANGESVIPIGTHAATVSAGIETPKPDLGREVSSPPAYAPAGAAAAPSVGFGLAPSP